MKIVDPLKEKNSQGIALILVMGTLALLTVLAVSFTTLMRHEEKSSRGSFQFIETRELATAGLQYAISILTKDLNDDQTSNQLYDAFDEDWITLFTGTSVDLDQDGTSDSRWINIHENGILIGRYAICIQDEAGKVNINTAASTSQNEGWSPYETNMAVLPGLSSTLASNIRNYRYGANTVPGLNSSQLAPDGDDDETSLPFRNDGIDNDGDGSIDEITEGEDDPIEFNPEIPYGDDQPYSSIEELDKASSSLTSSNVKTLKNYTTISSYDLNQYWNGAWSKKVNLNHLLTTDSLYNLVQGSSGSNSFRLTANMIDSLDRDNYPTAKWSSSASFNSTNAYIGLEGLQFNEVMRQTKWFAGENSTADRTGSGWSAFSTEDRGNEGTTGQWSWPWDNGTYNMRIYARTEAATPVTYTLETLSGSVTTLPTQVNNVTVSGGRINLQLLAPTQSGGGQQYSYFDKIEVQAGKYIEIINISQRAVTVDKTGSDSWNLYFGGSLSAPSADGLPARQSGGTALALSGATYPTSGDITLWSAAPTTYRYLIIADSLYGLDATYGNNNGSWSGGSAPESERLLVLPQLLSNLNSGTDLTLTDSQGNVIAYAPATAQFNILGFDDATLATYQSFSRSSPVNQQSAWTTSTATNEQTPGRNNNGVTQSNTGENKYWLIKDRPFASIGELGDVFLGTQNNQTYDLETSGNYLDKITLAAKRLEAENANSISWSNSETASDQDGTTRYVASNSNRTLARWDWTFDISITTDISKPFRLKSNTSYDMIAYGQFASNFESPSGTSRWVKPNHSSALDSQTVGNLITNGIRFDAYGNTSVIPKFDFLILTPDPYTWGKININTASSTVLQSLKGISSTLASNIVSYRPLSNSNPFNTIQELMSVSGIDETEFKPIANLITVRSDVFRVIVRAEKIVDANNNGTVDSGENISTITLDAIVDRNPSVRDPGTTDKHRIESLRYE